MKLKRKIGPKFAKRQIIAQNGWPVYFQTLEEALGSIYIYFFVNR